MMSKFVVIGVIIGSIILGILFWKLVPPLLKNNKGPSQAAPVTLNIWGLWESTDGFKAAFDNYQQLHPNVKINYTFQSTANYRTRVQTQIANGQGPDILLIHDSWVSMFVKSNTLAVAPPSIVSFDDYSKIFYPVAVDSLTSNKQIYAIPQEFDGLGLYYNEDLLKNQGIVPPTSWFDFVNDATKMTTADSTGHIQTAGAALGTTSNVDHWSDILGLLFLQQPSADLTKPNNDAGAQALQFYTSFATDPKHKTWDVNMPSSTQAFAEGRLAFYFGPSWEAQVLRASNPQLHFKVAPVPQLPGNPTVNWASFWAWGVASNSPNQTEAWKFLNYLTSGDGEKAVYQEASKTRLFGEPYSRVDLQSELANDPLVGAFVNQAPKASFWYLASDTYDAGINEEMIKYYEDAVNSVVGGGSPQDALGTAASGVSQVLDKYSGSAPAVSGQ